MIVTLILNFFELFLSGLVNLAPIGTLPPQIATAFAYFVGVVNAFSYVVPVSALFAAFAVVVGVDIAIVAWHFLNWIIRKIPGMQ